jgi:H+/Cl- antiporter ClcA
MSQGSKSPLGTLLTVITSLAAGYVVLIALQWVVNGLWTEIPENFFDGDVPWFYVLGLPVLAGVLVALLRKRADGHEPLSGLAIESISVVDFPFVLLAIAVTMAGGLILGPEVALISTGATIGGVIAAREPGASVKWGTTIGAVSAISALAIEPIRKGSLDISSGYVFSVEDLLPAAVAAVATAVVLVLVRLLASGLTFARGGDRPIVWQVALAGLAVGVIALVYQAWSGEPVDLVLTSGERTIKPLVELGSVGLILATVLAKSLGYAITMGGGYRGGPYFPAMFAGAGVGAAVGLLTDSPAQAPAIAGVVAAAIFLAKPGWIAVVGLGVIVGLIMGGPVLIPAALVGAAFGKLIPRLDKGAAQVDQDSFAEKE